MAASVKHTVLIVDDESVIASQTGFFFAWNLFSHYFQPLTSFLLPFLTETMNSCLLSCYSF
jgi:hypothetical protein